MSDPPEEPSPAELAKRLENAIRGDAVTPAMENIKRGFERSERSSEKTTVLKPSPRGAKAAERPGTKTLDYIALGLLLAPPAVVFEMFIKGESINWQRTAIATIGSWIAGGIVVLASHGWQSWRSTNGRVLPYLIAAENKFWVKAIIVAAFMGAALALSSVLSNPPPAGFTQHQVDEKIAASTAPIQAQLDATQKTMVDLRNELTAAKGESAATKQALDETRHNLSAMQEQNKQLSAGLTPAPVQNPEYRRISLEQMRILVREFAALKPDIPHIVVFRSNDVRGEANQYARDFMEAFDRAGLNPSGGTLSPNGLDETGVMIGVTDPTNSPPIAQKLAAALSRAAIQSSYAKVDGNLPDGFRFFVGPNPL